MIVQNTQLLKSGAWLLFYIHTFVFPNVVYGAIKMT